MKAGAPAYIPERAQIERLFSGGSEAEAVLLIQQIQRLSGPATAVVYCEAARDLGYGGTGLRLTEAIARAGTGELLRARALAEEILSASPGNLSALHLLAHISVASGDPTTGCDLFGRVVAECPEFPGAQAALAGLALPGPHYREVLARLHALLCPETYLEIGVETGVTLALAAECRIAVGVDPDPGALEVRLPSCARTHAMTSDAFFAAETRESAFGGRPVDLTFIDGLHWFEQALRDFVGAERLSAKESTIVLHDCLPVTDVSAERERRSTFWVGDTWKALECLLDARPDLRVRVVPAWPSGLVVVRNLDPRSTVLPRDMDVLVARYRDREEVHRPGKWPARYGIVSNDEAGLREAIGS